MTTTQSKINRDAFFKTIRETIFHGRITYKQFEGLQAIIDGFETLELTDTRWLAYILATALHETAYTLEPIEEFGKGKGKDYGKKLKRGDGPGKRIAYNTPDKLYYGRGFIQLTWYENYEYFGILEQPEKALELTTAVTILITGMRRGAFTRRKLSDYFKPGVKETERDWINARQIVNGMDRAERIADFAQLFYAGLK